MIRPEVQARGRVYGLLSALDQDERWQVTCEVCNPRGSSGTGGFGGVERLHGRMVSFRHVNRA